RGLTAAHCSRIAFPLNQYLIFSILPVRWKPAILCRGFFFLLPKFFCHDSILLFRVPFSALKISLWLEEFYLFFWFQLPILLLSIFSMRSFLLPYSILMRCFAPIYSK